MKQAMEFLLITILWIVAIILWATIDFGYLLYVLAGLHFVETLLIGVHTGLKFGKGLLKSIIMSMLFGYTWWLPLRKQMKEETFTSNDFMRRDTDFVKEAE